MREVYTRREAVVAVLLGLTVAALVWGPALLRIFGYTPTGDLQALPLLYTPRPPHARVSMSPASVAKVKPDKLVDINQADSASLQTLPGIGPTLANRIVSHRQAYGPFADRDQLMEVEGIGVKRFETLKPWIEAR